MSERINKLLANLGIASRREVEVMIRSGRISVNQKPAHLGQQISPEDRVTIDKRLVNIESAFTVDRRVIAYHKPEGEICTRKDPEGRKTVFDKLPHVEGKRWVAIGRLDINTSGLLLFTTDGVLANALMHPSAQVEREYLVRVMGDVTEEVILNLVNGVELEDGVATFHDVVFGGGEGINKWFYVVLMEGKNREVRRLWESQGIQVNRLKRVRYGSYFLEKQLAQGKWANLGQKDIDDLSKLAGLESVKLPQFTKQEQVKFTRQMEKQGFGRRGDVTSGNKKSTSFKKKFR